MTDKELKIAKVHNFFKKRYQRKPLLWLSEIFNEQPQKFKWSLHKGYENHNWDGSVDPMASIWEDIAMQKWVAGQSATGTGKTHLISRIALWFSDVYEDSFVITTAPSEPQLKLQIWSEISRVFDKFKNIRKNSRLLTLSLQVEWDNKSKFCISNRSHEVIGFTVGANNSDDSLVKAQGMHRKNMLIICDEATGMSSAIMNSFQNTCTASNNIIIALGNPDSESDQLSIFSKLPNVSSYRVSAFDYPNVVLNNEIYHGAVSRVSIERRRVKYGENSALFLSRVRGLVPEDSDSSLIKRTWIDVCYLYNENFGIEFNDDYNAYLGIDVANSEAGDKAAVCCGVGNKVTLIREFYCPNASHITHNIMLSEEDIEIKKITPFYLPKMADFNFKGNSIGIDAVGVGVSTVNTFLEYGVVPVGLQGGAWNEIIPTDEQGKPLYQFQNLRSQMYWECREDIRKQNIIFDLPYELFEQLKKELLSVKFALSSGKISIESKELIKKRLGGKSPNVADSFVYFNWIRKNYRVQNEQVYINLFGGH